MTRRSSSVRIPLVRPARPSTRRRAAAAALLALPLAAVPAAAQVDVGYRPENSPYRDLTGRHEFTVFAGYYNASEDDAGVAPQSGPMVGGRYELRIGGPARFFARLGAVSTERRVLSPNAAPANRDLGPTSLALVMADIGLSMNLTGQKSWYGLVPVVAAGLGVATDFEAADVGGYKIGTPFAISFGGGIRWTPGGRFQLRVDATDHFFPIRYPATYYTSATNNPPILAPGVADNQWKHNLALTLGASYLLGR